MSETSEVLLFLHEYDKTFRVPAAFYGSSVHQLPIPKEEDASKYVYYRINTAKNTFLSDEEGGGLPCYEEGEVVDDQDVEILDCIEVREREEL